MVTGIYTVRVSKTVKRIILLFMDLYINYRFCLWREAKVIKRL